MDFYIADTQKLGGSGRYSELLEFLRTADYTDAFICRRAKLERPEDFELDRKRRNRLPAPESPGDVLFSLFLAGDAVSNFTANHLLGNENIALLESMGLLQVDITSDHYYATVALYPVEELYIASDRWNTPDDSPMTVPDDTVYPAFIPNTRQFLRHLPDRPGARFLDLCGGTGIAALQAASHGAAEAWSGDIAERSTRFAEFNRLLNGVVNARAVTGDLYQNLQGMRFDVISAHPPYVPTLQPKWIFFSGGKDGEEITRRIIQGLPGHLNDGGVFVALAMGGDRAGQPFEQRIREWLGPQHTEFDIALIVLKELGTQQFALRANRGSLRTPEESQLWNKFFQELRVESLPYGFICIQRRSGAERTFTIRRQASPLAPRAPWEELLRWQTAACGESLAKTVLNSRLYALKHTEFEVLHQLSENGWIPSQYKLSTEFPFSVECRAEPWMAHTISLCNGELTGRDILRTLVQNSVLPASAGETEFAQAVASLVSGGFIRVDGFGFP